MELNFKNLASAYLKILEGYDFVIPEDVPANERTAFHGAAAAAHKAGKSHFDFGGKKYPVTMKKDAAKAINSEVQKEAKEDAEPEASSEVDGNDEKDSGSKKVPCPKCEGKGCAHCDNKGYHMSKVETKVTEGNMDGMCCKDCGDMFGQPTEGNCTYDAYDPKGKNWIKAEKQHESVEESAIKELTAAEKKLVNQMYNKDGTLTDIGKKVMNHGKKPGDKGYIESTNEDTNFVPHSNCPCGDDCNCDPCTCAEVKEEKQIDEISRSMTPMRNRFGGNVDPKKFDTYKKYMKTHKLDEPTVRMIHQNPDDAESKRMMKNPKYAQAVSLYIASMKNESTQVDEISADLAKRALDKRDSQANRLGSAAKRAAALKNRSLDKARQRRDREMGTNMHKDAEIKKHTDTAKRAGHVGSNLHYAARKADKKADKTYDYMKKRGMKTEELELDEKKIKLTPKDIKRAIASIKPPKKKPTLPKAPWDKKEEVEMKKESVNRDNWIEALQSKKLQEAEDAKTKTSAPTANHKSDDATRDTYDKQLSTRKGEKDFVDMHNPETPEFADVNRVLPKTFAAYTAGVKAGGGKTNDAPGDKTMPKNDGK